MLVGVSFGRVNGEMDFGLLFTVLPINPAQDSALMKVVNLPYHAVSQVVNHFGPLVIFRCDEHVFGIGGAGAAVLVSVEEEGILPTGMATSERVNGK